MAKRVTPPPRVADLVTGHFRRGARYYAYRPEGTDDWLLIYTVRGRGRFGHDGGHFISPPGHVVLLRPGSLHDYATDPTLGRWELLWTHFHPRQAWISLLTWPQVAPGLMALSLEQVGIRRRVEQGLVRMHQSATGALHRRSEFALNALEEVLLWCDQHNPLREHPRIDPRLQSAMDVCCQNLARRHSVEGLAEVAGLSGSRFSHLFREQVGTTPQRFIERQRLARAAQLLEMTSLTLKEIAAEVGFDTPFYLSLRFRRQYGSSPKHYRQRHGAERRPRKREDAKGAQGGETQSNGDD